MRRRILLAILGTVVLSLVLAGTGTYLLLRRQADRTTQASLRAEAESIVGLLSLSNPEQTGAIRQQKIVSGLRLEGISVLVIGPAGVLRGDLPEGLTDADVNKDVIEAGTTSSGRRGGLVWAASSAEGTRESIVTVVLTREAEPPRAPVGWFVIAGGIALAVGAAVAARLSDTLTRPLRDAQAATVQIAAGDLSTRLPDPPAGDHGELADLARSINSMAVGLAQSRGLERQFLLSVSHDLRTPLTSIRGYADAIADGTAVDPVDAARIIGAESQRLSRLVGDLLDLARLDAHEFSFELRSVPVAEVVTETAEGFRPTADEVGVALVVLEPDRPAPALIDPDRLAQAVANLVENGLKHAWSEVVVSTTVDVAGATAVSVVDDGPGIAPADLPHVFERLYTTDRRPRRQVGGTGLGLAIVREVVSGIGGRVWVESPALPDGRGARFVIALPPPPPPPGA